jgi:hypothetical protein
MRPRGVADRLEHVTIMRDDRRLHDPRACAQPSASPRDAVPCLTYCRLVAETSERISEGRPPHASSEPVACGALACDYYRHYA